MGHRSMTRTAKKDEALTVEEAAAYLDRSVRTVYRLIAEGEIKAYRTRGRASRYVRAGDLDAYLGSFPRAINE